MKTLGALSEQTTEQQFEVVVALDTCSDDSAALLATLQTRFPMSIVVGEWQRASAARNAGARSAAGEIVIFLDDDIIVGPTFIDAHVDAHARGNGRSVAIGYSKPVIADERRLFSQALRRWWEDLFTQMGQAGHRFTFRDFLSGNVSMPRAVFFEEDGFDESFACREDYELGYRLLRRGCRFTYAPQALGLHHDDRSLKPSLQRAHAEGKADVQFADKHPELLPELTVTWPTGSTLGENILVHLPIRLPALALALQALIVALLGPLEKARARRTWAKLQQAARRLSYMRGVASSGMTIHGYRQLLATRYATIPPDITTISDPVCLESSAEQIDSEGPAGLIVDFSGVPIIHFPPLLGAEPVRSQHVLAMASLPHVRLMDEARRAIGQMSLANAGSDRLPAEANAPRGAAQLPPNAKQGLQPLGRSLVRIGLRPVAWLSPDLAERSPDSDEHRLLRNMPRELARAAVLERLEPSSARVQPGVSVIVCTRDRTENLRRCLAALQELDYPDWELIVVDNAPSDSATRRLVQDMPDVRYVREDTPGLDNARNRGVRESRHEIIAFTDDDTMVDAGWLQAIARALADEEVAAVTGLVAPMKLDTPARVYFEDVYGGMGKGLRSRWFRKSELDDIALIWSSACGVGANMAFRKSTFAAVGPFDPNLDVGTPTRGGGDIEMFHRVVAGGHLLKYEPRALIWHEHRETWDQLRRQLADNSCSFVCYLKTVVRNGSISPSKALRFALVDWLGYWFLNRFLRPGPHRRDLILAELRGVFDGFSAYRRAQTRSRS